MASQATHAVVDVEILLLGALQLVAVAGGDQILLGEIMAGESKGVRADDRQSFIPACDRHEAVVDAGTALLGHVVEEVHILDGQAVQTHRTMGLAIVVVLVPAAAVPVDVGVILGQLEADAQAGESFGHTTVGRALVFHQHQTVAVNAVGQFDAKSRKAGVDGGLTRHGHGDAVGIRNRLGGLGKELEITQADLVPLVDPAGEQVHNTVVIDGGAVEIQLHGAVQEHLAFLLIVGQQALGHLHGKARGLHRQIGILLGNGCRKGSRLIILGRILSQADLLDADLGTHLVHEGHMGVVGGTGGASE